MHYLHIYFNVFLKKNFVILIRFSICHLTQMISNLLSAYKDAI